MGAGSLSFDSWSLVWRRQWQKLAPARGRHDCVHTHRGWRSLRLASVWLEGSRYCDACLEPALHNAFRQGQSMPRRLRSPHRIPLGLTLLSRQQVSAGQLQAALAAQKHAGHGRIGEWLQALGFVTERQVTIALARQWSCPVLRDNFAHPASSQAPQIPLALLAAFDMVPVDFVEARRILHVACCEGIEYSALYAVEQMTECRTQPWMASPSFVRPRLQAVSAQRRENEIVFDGIADDAEFARIIRSYCIRVGAGEICVAACHPHRWVRLLRRARAPLDLLCFSGRDVRPATTEINLLKTPLRSGMPVSHASPPLL